MNKKPPQIAVFYDPGNAISRQAVSGILRYANATGPWSISLIDDRNEPILPNDCRGTLVVLPTIRVMATLDRAKQPTVLVNFMRPPGELIKLVKNLPHVQSNSCDFGIKAAEFFLARTPRTFVYVGTSDAPPWDRERGEAFAERIRKSGQEPHLYPTAEKPLPPNREAVRLQKWLKTLPKPLAIFAAEDAQAQLVLEACRHAGITVPYEATILGTDNDEWLCELTQPRLSSIPFRAEESGFEAAHMLDGILQHRTDPSIPLPPLMKFMPPHAVVERESTDERIVEDPIVGKALSFIHLHKGLNIRTTDVQKAVGVSLNWIETRFRRTLETSVINEIGRVRMKTILKLIRETEISSAEIARRCGFTNTETLYRLVKKETGRTIGSIRHKPSSADG